MVELEELSTIAYSRPLARVPKDMKIPEQQFARRGEFVIALSVNK